VSDTTSAQRVRPASLPSFQRRLVLTVMIAFGAAYAVVLATIIYNGVKREFGEFDKALLVIGKSLALALDDVPVDDNTEAAVQMFRTWDRQTKRLSATATPSATHLMAMTLDGRFRSVAADAPALDIDALADGFSDREIGGKMFRVIVSRSQRWKVVMLDEPGIRTAIALRDLGGEVALYLLLIGVIVMLPLWLSVRTALQPLQKLSSQVARRKPDDTHALHVQRPYRELAPLVEALDKLFVRVAAGMAREKGFVHDAAHEMRTPLAVITAQVHVLANSEGQERDVARARLEGAVARASHLTRQLLRLAQADAGASAQDGTGTSTPVDVMDMTRDVLSHAEDRAQEHGAELSLDGPDALVLPLRQPAHEHLLRSVLENLIDNALRYGCPQGPGGCVQVSVSAKQAQINVVVADNGPGIGADMRERVFERFCRGSGERETGAGLGLAIVRGAVRAMGGQVHITTGLNGRGCGVVVALPSA
jgi:two-component system, OmpR family, sensor histidine kinase QseC